MKCVSKFLIGIGAFCFYYILLCSLCGCELDEPCKKIKNMVKSQTSNETENSSNTENQW